MQACKRDTPNISETPSNISETNYILEYQGIPELKNLFLSNTVQDKYSKYNVKP